MVDFDTLNEHKASGDRQKKQKNTQIINFSGHDSLQYIIWMPPPWTFPFFRPIQTYLFVAVSQGPLNFEVKVTIFYRFIQ